MNGLKTSRAPSKSPPTLLPDREIWACALQVLETHDRDAERFVAERLGACALAGDQAGLAVWKRIARRIDEIRHPVRA